MTELDGTPVRDADEKLEERRREILEEIRRNMTLSLTASVVFGYGFPGVV